MKQSFFSILITLSAVIAAAPVHASPSSCGIPDDMLALTVELIKPLDPQAQVIALQNGLNDYAITSKQAGQLLSHIKPEMKTQAAISLYPHVCDPQNWTGIYTNRAAVQYINVVQLDATIVDIKTKPADFNQKKHDFMSRCPKVSPCAPPTVEKAAHRTEHANNDAGSYLKSLSAKRDITSDTQDEQTKNDYLAGYNKGYAKAETRYQEGLKAGQQNCDKRFEQGSDEGYQKGYKIGYDKGYDAGHSSGYSSGYSSGKSDGYSLGYSSGYSSGQNDGYSSGQNDGYNKGLQNSNTSNQIIVTNNGSSCNPTSDSTIDDIVEKIKHAYSDDRLNIVRLAEKSYYFNASQAAKILKALYSSEERAEAAVILFNSICDKVNWDIVLEEVSYSDKDDVNRRVGL